MGDRFVQNMEMAQETGVGVVSCCQGDLETEGNLWGKREGEAGEGRRRGKGENININEYVGP